MNLKNLLSTPVREWRLVRYYLPPDTRLNETWLHLPPTGLLDFDSRRREAMAILQQSPECEGRVVEIQSILSEMDKMRMDASMEGSSAHKRGVTLSRNPYAVVGADLTCKIAWDKGWQASARAADFEGDEG